MSSVGAEPLSVSLRFPGSAGPMTGALRAAVDLLAVGGAVRLTGRAAEIEHTLGEERARGDAPGHVHTVDRIPMRRGFPDRLWSRRQPSMPHTVWVTHGELARRVLVATGLAPGERVHALPVLAARPTAPPTRREARRALGVAPGVRVVTGTTRALPGRCRWAERLTRRARSDLRVLDACVHGPAALAAADVIVADCPDLTGWAVAAPALDAGPAVVALDTDSTAELLAAGHAHGSVVAHDPDAVVSAVLAHLDLLPARSGSRPPTGEIDDLARRLFRVYQHALAWSWRAAS